MAPKDPLVHSHGQSALWKEAKHRAATTRAARALAVRVGELREEAKWSREQAAERVDIHVVHYARIEAGKANPTLAVLVALARAFELPLAELFQKTSAEKRSPGTAGRAPQRPKRGRDSKRHVRANYSKSNS